MRIYLIWAAEQRALDAPQFAEGHQLGRSAHRVPVTGANAH